MTDTLSTIVAHKRDLYAARKAQMALADVEADARAADARPDRVLAVGRHVVVGDEDADPKVARIAAVDADGNAAPVAYATAAILTGTTFWLGGFMREQVCIYMCPWPRIQTAMLDEKSLIVTYKDWRGEQRGSLKTAAKNPGQYGDCIDCQLCVAVCPTGIDIREGPQIGCITCALCVDACDKAMASVGRPRGLIGTGLSCRILTFARSRSSRVPWVMIRRMPLRFSPSLVRKRFTIE